LGVMGGGGHLYPGFFWGKIGWWKVPLSKIFPFFFLRGKASIPASRLFFFSPLFFAQPSFFSFFGVSFLWRIDPPLWKEGDTVPGGIGTSSPPRGRGVWFLFVGFSGKIPCELVKGSFRQMGSPPDTWGPLGNEARKV